MTAYLSRAIAGHAEQIIHDHKKDQDGWWCVLCHLAGEGQIMAGKCEPVLRAQAFITAYEEQERQRSSRV